VQPLIKSEQKEKDREGRQKDKTTTAKTKSTPFFSCSPFFRAPSYHISSSIDITMTSRKRASDTAIVESGSQSFDNQIQSSSTFGSIDGRRSLASRPKLRVRIKKWHGVAHWTWNCGDDDEVCGICQSAYEGVAPGAKSPGDECPVVWGKCGHSFHLICVQTWLATRSTCPMCRSAWEFGADKPVEE